MPGRSRCTPCRAKSRSGSRLRPDRRPDCVRSADASSAIARRVKTARSRSRASVARSACRATDGRTRRHRVHRHRRFHGAHGHARRRRGARALGTPGGHGAGRASFDGTGREGARRRATALVRRPARGDRYVPAPPARFRRRERSHRRRAPRCDRRRRQRPVVGAHGSALGLPAAARRRHRGSRRQPRRPYRRPRGTG